MPSPQIFVDASTGAIHTVGIAAVARTPTGEWLGWLSQQLPPQTNNEAEYRAALLGLELAQKLRLRQVEIIMDSQIVVFQMEGHSRVHSPRLRPLHQQLCQRTAAFTHVTFRHVPREQNELADALATEAMHGRVLTQIAGRKN